MNLTDNPQLVLLAGPNGAGKTTVAEFLLNNGSLNIFVNADTIAKGMQAGSSGVGDIEAGRILLKRINRGIALRENLSFETTLSGKIWTALIAKAQQVGYEVTLCYVGVRSPDIAVERVQARVLEGGHAIPEKDIRRRFKRSLSNFLHVYSEQVNNWYFFDNSDKSALLIASSEGKNEAPQYFPDIFNFYQKIGSKHER